MARHPVAGTPIFVRVRELPVAEDVNEQSTVVLEPPGDVVEQPLVVAHVLEHLDRHHAIEATRGVKVVHVRRARLDIHQSEAFGLWCGDIGPDGIRIERSWYKGKYEAPKTPKSERMVGVPDSILERLAAWIEALPAQGPSDCVFPSSTLATPIWPESVLRNYVRPKLRPAGLGWINFAVLRRSHSTLHKQRNSDLKIIADQQGHGMRTHLDAYVQSGIEERKAEASKLYADFIGVLRNRG